MPAVDNKSSIKSN